MPNHMVRVAGWNKTACKVSTHKGHGPETVKMIKQVLTAVPLKPMAARCEIRKRVCV